MAKTLQKKFAEALAARGETEVASRSTRYRVFTRAAGGFYFLGKAGSLRFGRAVSVSYPVPDRLKDQLLGREPKTPKTPTRLRTADCGSRYGMPVAAALVAR